jgi:hypothetical protein
MAWARLRPNIGIVILLAAYLALALVYAAQIPYFEGPDEGAHFRYVAYLNRARQLPPLDAATAAFSHELVQQPPLYYLAAAALTLGRPLDETLTLELVNPQKGLAGNRRATVSVPGLPTAAAEPLLIARGLSLVFGALTVVGAWWLARSAFPGRAWLPLAVAGVVAFNPQFLFSSVTITNDTAVAGLAALSVALAYATLRHSRRQWVWLAVGVLAGLTALAKYSGLLVLLPVGVLLLAQAWREGWRALAVRGLLLVAGVAGTAGFWYARNLAVAGQLAPLEAMLPLLPGLVRPAPLSWGEAWGAAAWLRPSYWGVFGYGVVAPEWYHAAIYSLLVAGGIGLAIGLVRRLARHDRPFFLPVGVAALWFGAISATLLNWIRLIHFSDQGRLLFPAAAAVALLLVVGWKSWLPKRWQPGLFAVMLAVLAGLAVSQVATLQAAYALPAPLAEPPHPQRPLDVRFAGGMRLIGVDLPEGAAMAPGVPLPITLYFDTERTIEDFYTLFLHLSTADDAPLLRLDTVPGGGRHPTRQWRAGTAFADSYSLAVDGPLPDGLGQLSIGFYRHDDIAARQPVTDAAGNPGGDRVVIPVRLHSYATEPKAAQETGAIAPIAAWEQGIILADAQIQTDKTGAPAAIDLSWRADETQQRDYAVFLQVLDADDHIVAQVDRAPQEGEYPTSTWRAGDVIADRYELAVPPGAKWDRVIVGLYEPVGGRRLTVEQGGEGDAVVLLRAGGQRISGTD